MHNTEKFHKWLELSHVCQERVRNLQWHIEFSVHSLEQSMHVVHVVGDEEGDARTLLMLWACNQVWRFPHNLGHIANGC